jgi:hypothetical protein
MNHPLALLAEPDLLMALRYIRNGYWTLYRSRI